MFQLDLKKASTVAVHVGLILGVAVYTLFGALTMQFLESPDRIKGIFRRDLGREGSETHEKTTKVYRGTEIALIDPKVHECVQQVLTLYINDSSCEFNQPEHIQIEMIDRCYQEAEVDKIYEVNNTATKPSTTQPTIEEEIEAEIEKEEEKWSFGNSLIFTFTVITTIGYGHVAPETFYGRLFVIIYGCIGVPLTLLTIADMGMFFTKVLKLVVSCITRVVVLICRPKKKKNKPNEIGKTEVNGDKVKTEESVEKVADDSVVDVVDEEEEVEEEEEEEEESHERNTTESIALFATFTIYLLFGARVLSVYEPEMDFFKALYFNFVTLTTIGLGDFVPKSFDYLVVTLFYIGIGLTLTTMAVEIAADLLKKVHYVGRKMENMGNAVVWFGGKKMTMKNLMKNLGDQFNISEEEMKNLNMDQFVENAIKVEAGELKTLRKPSEEVQFREPRAVSYTNLRQSVDSRNIKFVDDRHSKTTIPEETSRTVDTLPILHEISTLDYGRGVQIPLLDLDMPMFTDSSLPTSFDEEFLKTFTFSNRK